MRESRQSVIHLWSERLIRQLKRDRNYALDSRITIKDLIEIFWHRGLTALRGLWVSWQLGHSGSVLFIGKNVTLRHKRCITLGNSVIIEDGVFIDALSRNGVVFGNNVTIAKNTTIQCTGVIQELGEGLEIGDNSAVGAYSFIGAQGGIKIGSNVIMGPRISIQSENHGYQELGIPIRLQPTTRQGIVIEDDCWIGTNSIILDGVHIHSGCVIAAGSVVTKDIPPNSVVAGVPAHVIKGRGKT